MQRIHGRQVLGDFPIYLIRNNVTQKKTAFKIGKSKIDNERENTIRYTEY